VSIHNTRNQRKDAPATDAQAPNRPQFLPGPLPFRFYGGDSPPSRGREQASRPAVISGLGGRVTVHRLEIQRDETGGAPLSSGIELQSAENDAGRNAGAVAAVDMNGKCVGMLNLEGCSRAVSDDCIGAIFDARESRGEVATMVRWA